MSVRLSTTVSLDGARIETRLTPDGAGVIDIEDPDYSANATLYVYTIRDAEKLADAASEMLARMVAAKKQREAPDLPASIIAEAEANPDPFPVGVPI